jgi:restriction system protein
MMAVPGYEDLMLPLLQLAGDGQEHKFGQAMTALAERMQISQEDQDALLPSGTQTRFYNRFCWAVSYLQKSLLLEKPGRGRFRIAARGRDVLADPPQRIDNEFLEKYPEFIEFRSKRRLVVADPTSAEPSNTTPEERLEGAYKEIREALADEVLTRARDGTPKFFERLVVDLLVAMGYGGSRADAAQVVGRSGDEGVDGVIKEDRLGLDMVYVQAKKWEGPVGPGEIDKFVGSLSRKKAHKGVFITTGSFTSGARDAAREAAVKIVLIDGEQLAQLMIDHGVGVTDSRSYVVKKMDNDYFDEA